MVPSQVDRLWLAEFLKGERASMSGARPPREMRFYLDAVGIFAYRREKIIEKMEIKRLAVPVRFRARVLSPRSLVLKRCLRS